LLAILSVACIKRSIVERGGTGSLSARSVPQVRHVSCSQIFEREDEGSVLGPRPANKVKVGWRGSLAYDSVLVWGPGAPSEGILRTNAYSFETSGGTYFFLGIRGESVDIGIVSCFPAAFAEPGFDEELPEVVVIVDPDYFFAEAYEFTIPVSVSRRELV